MNTTQKRKQLISNLRLLGLLFFSFLVLLPTNANSQQVKTDITVHREALPILHRSEMSDFGYVITDYIEGWDWLQDDLPHPVKINFEAILAFLGSAVKTRYGSRLTVNNGVDIKYLDRWWIFDYQREDMLLHDESQFNSLTWLIDYYVHLMIGHELDKYVELGGNYHFQRANTIALDGRFSREFQRGWDERLKLIDGILTEAYKPYRLIRNRFYRGLKAQQSNKNTEAKILCFQAVEIMTQLYQQNSKDEKVRDFLSAHYLQLADIFSTESTRTIYDTLISIDPTHRPTYEKYATRIVK
tara:strand:- start:45458 stop:46354 length:897 start_codon:yes stop_codon:yes gene_type:complete